LGRDRRGRQDEARQQSESGQRTPQDTHGTDLLITGHRWQAPCTQSEAGCQSWKLASTHFTNTGSDGVPAEEATVPALVAGWLPIPEIVVRPPGLVFTAPSVNWHPHYEYIVPIWHAGRACTPGDESDSGSCGSPYPMLALYSADTTSWEPEARFLGVG
jgi:hypothetical protein